MILQNIRAQDVQGSTFHVSWMLTTRGSINEGKISGLKFFDIMLTFQSKIDELEKQLVTLRDAVQSQHPAVIVANLSTDVVGTGTPSHVPSLSQFAPQLSQSPHISQGSPYAVSSTALLTVSDGAQRPAAQSIRAIDSLAFSLEEIDTLFNM